MTCPVWSDFDIGRLQIPVDDAFLVGGFETIGDLHEDRDRFVERKVSAGDPLGEGLSLHQFHDKERLAVRDLEPVKRCDVRMIERREQLGLTLESIQPLSVARKFLGQHFDGHFAAELGIPSSVDFFPMPPAPRVSRIS